MTGSQTYDALLIVSFGGPERPEDVMPFLRNVVAGRGVPDERLAVVAEHYYKLGGKSPINDQCRALIETLGAELREQGIELPIYWGNRNWQPLLADTVAQMQADGVRHALAFVTSAFSSYSGCRQYLENIEQARQRVGANAPAISKLRGFYNHPGFIETMTARVNEGLAQLGEAASEARLVFTAHSIPGSMAKGCAYQAQLAETCALVARAAGRSEHDIVFQSRSGPPQVPWLEPDILDYLPQLADRGVRSVVLSPIGFVSDHMEVVWDLDTEAQQLAQQLGLRLVRAGTAGVHPRFVAMIRELIQERLRAGKGRAALGTMGPLPDACPAGCCTYTPGRPPPRRAP